MSECSLFTDASVNAKTKDGYGAVLLISAEDHSLTQDELVTRIKLRKFAETSSSKIELQTLLWALADLPSSCSRLTIYTDSQSIFSLLERRLRLDAKDYKNSKGVPLSNAELYKEFYQAHDQIGFKIVKVKGHKPSSQRDTTDQRFNLVDRASRKACRASALSP